jgi:hypothetical protein
VYNCFGFNKELKGSIRLRRKKDPRLRGRAAPRRAGGGLHQYGCVILHMYMLGYAYNMLVNLE